MYDAEHSRPIAHARVALSLGDRQPAVQTDADQQVKDNALDRLAGNFRSERIKCAAKPSAKNNIAGMNRFDRSNISP